MVEDLPRMYKTLIQSLALKKTKQNYESRKNMKLWNENGRVQGLKLKSGLRSQKILQLSFLSLALYIRMCARTRAYAHARD